MMFGDNKWYKIYIKDNGENQYLYYRPNKGFYWEFGIFATLFLKQHILYDPKLISYLKEYNYHLEECTELYSYHSYMKYHGKTS